MSWKRRQRAPLGLSRVLLRRTGAELASQEDLGRATLPLLVSQAHQRAQPRQKPCCARRAALRRTHALRRRRRVQRRCRVRCRALLRCRFLGLLLHSPLPMRNGVGPPGATQCRPAVAQRLLIRSRPLSTRRL